jgi:hypothetical protein
MSLCRGHLFAHNHLDAEIARKLHCLAATYDVVVVGERDHWHILSGHMRQDFQDAGGADAACNRWRIGMG